MSNWTHPLPAATAILQMLSVFLLTSRKPGSWFSLSLHTIICLSSPPSPVSPFLDVLVSSSAPQPSTWSPSWAIPRRHCKCSCGPCAHLPRKSRILKVNLMPSQAGGNTSNCPLHRLLSPVLIAISKSISLPGVSLPKCSMSPYPTEKSFSLWCWPYFILGCHSYSALVLPCTLFRIRASIYLLFSYLLANTVRRKMKTS